MSHIEIMPASSSDIPEIIDLHREVQIVTYSGVAPDITEEAMTHHLSGDWATRKKTEFQDRLNSKDSLVSVARDREKIVGFFVSPTEDYSGAISVTPARQRESIGSRLVYDVGRRVPIEKDVRLTVVPNTGAVEFYKELGFRPTGRDIEFSTLRGGEVLPQIELAITPEDARASIGRLGLLLSSSD